MPRYLATLVTAALLVAPLLPHTAAQAPTAVFEAEDFPMKTAGGRVASSLASNGAYWSLWSNGHVQTNVSFLENTTTQLQVRARGTPLGGVQAHMVVTLDGAIAINRTVNGTFSWYVSAPRPIAAGLHAVRIRFTNDALGSTEDRNLHADALRFGNSSLPPPLNEAPTATFSAATTNMTVNLDASASSDPEGNALTYAWTFGDGGTGAGVRASHAYAANGTFAVTLTVSDGNLSGKQSKPVTVGGPPLPPPPREAEAFATRTAGGRQTDASASGGAVWNLWSNGYLQDNVAADGVATLVVVARGTSLGGVWPTMVVSVDGAVVRTFTVSSSTLRQYPVAVLAAGTHALRLAFTNDAASGSEDRNLLLDVVRHVSGAAVAPPASVRVDPSAAGGRIDPRIYSFNVASWVPSDFSPPNATFVAMLRQLHPALLRFPPGHDGQHTYFDPTNNMTSPPSGFSHLLRGDKLDQFIATARQAGADPMLEVNLKTGTPEMAASLVRYVNVQRGHNLTWFELGNEPDLGGAYDTDARTEGQKFLRFASAMRAVDPSIRLVGGSIMTGPNAFGTNGRVAWLPPFSDVVGNRTDALSWHWYPLDSDQPSKSSPAYPSVAHLLQESAPDWRPSGMDFAERACAGMEPLRQQTGAEHWVTEMGPDSGAKQAPGITNGQAAAVWIADALPRLAECGADAVFQFAVRQQAQSALTLMTYDRQPLPEWGTYQLLAAHYQGTWLRLTKEAPLELAAHAAKAPDGRVSLLLANKGSVPLRLNVTLGEATQAHTWTLQADTPTSTTARVNGAPLDRNAVLRGFPPVDKPLGVPIDVPAYAVVVLEAL